jgi:hypothetical protein
MLVLFFSCQLLFLFLLAGLGWYISTLSMLEESISYPLLPTSLLQLPSAANVTFDLPTYHEILSKRL